MIKEALQYVVGLGEAKMHTVAGRVFSDKQLHEIKTPLIKGFQTSTLQSIVDYISMNPDRIENTVIIHIESETSVTLTTERTTNEEIRHILIQAKPVLPTVHFGKYLDVESFIIQMQSKFISSEMTRDLLKIVGNVKEEQVKSTCDDGVSQSVVAKTGIARVEEITVPNPVPLRPFRTFNEVEQPESLFVFRMQNGPQMALFEADGGIWRLEAMQNIRTFFNENQALKDLITEKKVVVIG